MTAAATVELSALSARARAATAARVELARVEWTERGPDVRVRAGSGWIRVHSQHNPRAEAESWLDRSLDGEGVPPVAVVFGVGLGHVVDALLARRPDVRVLAFELEPALLSTFLDRRDWTSFTASGQVTIACDPDYTTPSWRWPAEALERPPLILVHPVLGQHRPDELRRARAALKQLLFEQRANRSAEGEFGRLYLEHTLANGAALAREGDVVALDDAARGLPIVLCAPGPSLDRLLPELRAYRERAVYIALDTALRPLLAAGIEPDLVVAVDPSLLNGRHLIGLPRHRRTWLVCDPSLDPRAMRPFEGRAFLYRVGDNHPWPWLHKIGIDRTCLRVWGSVVTAACDLALRLGGHTIAFAGVDLAYTNGQPYCRGTSFESDWAAHQARDGLAIDEMWRRRLPASKVDEADVHGSRTETAPHLVAFRNWLRGLTESSDDRRFVNVTRAGILHGGRIQQQSLPALLGGSAVVGGLGSRWSAAHAASRRDDVDLRARLGSLARSPVNTRPWREWLEAVPDLDRGRLERHVDRARTELSAAATRITPPSLSASSTPSIHESFMTSYPEWIDVPYDATNFWAKAPLEWRVAPENVQTLSYWLGGKTMTLSFKIVGSTLTGDPANEVYIRIPGGYTPAKGMANAIWMASLSARETGYATVHKGFDALVLFRATESDYVTNEGLFFVFGQITFEVE